MSATIQTTFPLYFNEAKLGMPYDRTPDIARSYVAESAIRYGQAVVAGTDADREVITPSATGQAFMGISIGVWQIEQQLTAYPTDSRGLYVAGLVVPVMRRGTIWVRVNTDVSVNDPVYFVFTDADPTKIGNFQNVAGAVADLVPQAKFLKAAKAGDLAVVELNLP